MEPDAPVYNCAANIQDFNWSETSSSSEASVPIADAPENLQVPIVDAPANFLPPVYGFLNGGILIPVPPIYLMPGNPDRGSPEPNPEVKQEIDDDDYPENPPNAEGEIDAEPEIKEENMEF